MERLVRTSPAYDFRGQTPDYGQHPLELHFIVKDSRGALVLSINTGWYIEETTKARIGGSGSFGERPTSNYVTCSFHQPATIYTDDPHENCGWLDGDTCETTLPFGLSGKPLGDLFLGFISHGIDWLWEELERHFNEIVRQPR